MRIIPRPSAASPACSAFSSRKYFHSLWPAEKEPVSEQGDRRANKATLSHFRIMKFSFLQETLLRRGCPGHQQKKKLFECQKQPYSL